MMRVGRTKHDHVFIQKSCRVGQNSSVTDKFRQMFVQFAWIVRNIANEV